MANSSSPSAPPAATSDEQLKLPHDRDEATRQVDDAPRHVMEQAKKDLDAGLVDTDLRGTAGLDAERLKQLVPPAGTGAKR